jgi:glycosyltransferase A (GT-A) superfamily protein (DUF2064 family)
VEKMTRLLTLKIQEPLPGQVLCEMAADHGPEEAARRYRAIVLTTLRQLRGLSDSRLRLLAEPEDAAEAIRFWLLPSLAEKWQAKEAAYQADGWVIDFGENPDASFQENFPIHATGEILCPQLGARWVHAALLGMGRTTAQVIGPASQGGDYFSAHFTLPVSEPLPPRLLPELPIIRTSADWLAALDGPLGPALKKAWEKEGSHGL